MGKVTERGAAVSADSVVLAIWALASKTVDAYQDGDLRLALRLATAGRDFAQGVTGRPLNHVQRDLLNASTWSLLQITMAIVKAKEEEVEKERSGDEGVSDDTPADA